MSGRRLLDAALVFNATRTVARKHFQIRSEQLDLWRKTSALAKVFRSDRVDIRAARDHQTAVQQSTFYATNIPKADEETIPSRESVGEQGENVANKTGLQQDHHYERSGKNTIADPLHEEALGIRQEKPARYPTPDGSIPPVGAPVDTGAPQGIKEDVTAERAAAPRPTPLEEAKSSPVEALKPQSSQDSTIPEPIVKMSAKIPEHDVVPEQEEVPEGINTDVFHSPRIARMLAGKSKAQKSGQDLALKGVKETPVENSQLTEGKDQDTFNVRQSGPSGASDKAVEADAANTKAQAADADTRELANSIASDANLENQVSSQPSD